MLIDLNNLASDGFEDLMDDLFTKEQWAVTFHAGEGPDGGRDLVIERTPETISDFGRDIYIVQCKRYANTVNAGHVQDISDTVRRFGAEGFVLAVTSRISEPLATKLRDLTTQGIECQVLRPQQIYEMITKSDDVFIKYFPLEYDNYSQLQTRYTPGRISSALQERYQDSVTADEGARIQRQLSILGFQSMDEFTRVLDDDGIRDTVDAAYSQVLGRNPVLYEVVHHSVGLSRIEGASRQEILVTFLMSTPEYLSNARFLFSYSDFPVGVVRLDAVHQEAFGLRTYHSDYANGEISVSESNVMDVARVVSLRSIGNSAFRVIGFKEKYFRKIRFICMDYLRDCTQFDVYILVRSQSGRNYFIQYIDDEGDDSVAVDSGIEYLQFHRRGQPNGPVLRREMQFAEDFRSLKGEDIDNYLGLFIGVEGALTIFRLMLGSR